MTVANGPWRDALVIPIHGPGLEVGIVSIAAPEIDLPLQDRAAIHLSSLYAFERARTLVQDPEGKGSARPLPDLSNRERQCLEYVPMGLSDIQIAARLNISRSTAKYHVEQARRKLGARTRAQAVALAVRHRIVWDQLATS